MQFLFRRSIPFRPKKGLYLEKHSSAVGFLFLFQPSINILPRWGKSFLNEQENSARGTKYL
jgi:hypothetical protein